MEHKEQSSMRGTVHYWITRNEHSKHTLVFTHGLTADHTMFEKQVDFFTTHNTVITWDVPMHGLSRPYTSFTYANCVEDLRAILDAEGIKRAVFVGMSMGGYVSQLFAATYPERTAGFVALDTTPFGHRYYTKADIWWLHQVAPMAKWFPDRMLRQSMASAVSKTTYAKQTMLRMLASLTKADIIAQLDIAYRGFAKENQDIALTCPVLILLGECDTTGKVRAYCEAWAKQTGYPLTIIKGAAHFSNGDNPEQVNAEIKRFVESLA